MTVQAASSALRPAARAVANLAGVAGLRVAAAAPAATGWDVETGAWPRGGALKMPAAVA